MESFFSHFPIYVSVSQVAIVKGKRTVTRSLKFRIRATPAQIQRINTFEARYALSFLLVFDRLFTLYSSTCRVESVSPDFDNYRITHLLESVENKQALDVLNPPRRVTGGEPHDEAQVGGESYSS